MCEVTSATGSGTCGQTSSQTGYWTKYTYDALGDLTGVTQNAQSGATQTRSYSYDGLGRMTSETEAESGTTTYFYDSASGCASTSSGDLVKKLDAVGNAICYAYDALHRVTSVTYSGPYATSTPNKYFVYDSATVNNVAMANAKGRLAEAYTATCSTCSKITDLGFSHSVRGEVSDVYESTPHSGGYYHVNATFWANGAVDQLSGLPGLPAITYGVDGEGRPSSASAASGQNPATSTAYNVASLPTQLNLGSGDSDAFQYDANTDRMTQYQANINGQSIIGQLTWNANGTLGTLKITDPFNAGNTQTCGYGYDDLARIASANCGSVWAQTFSYDAFGNITKSGSMSFQPTYSSSTNRMASLPGFTPSYDANGNVVNDSLHSYAWDAVGRPVTIDGIGITYDALGRMVEQQNGTSYTEIAYAPWGLKLALMNGQSLTKAFVPLPGAATAVYTSTGLAYYRHSDWLSSSRVTSTPGRALYGDVAYAPFGEPYAQSGTSDLSFTGQNQDTVSALYDFQFREYGIQGRWPSPDPLGPGAFSLADPQSLNGYAYVRNTPTSFVDPLGLKRIPSSYPLFTYDELISAYLAILAQSVSFDFNEFDLLPVQTGTAYLFHSDTPYFQFEDFSTDELLQFAAEGEIDLVSATPIYGVLLDLDGGGPQGPVQPPQPPPRPNPGPAPPAQQPPVVSPKPPGKGTQFGSCVADTLKQTIPQTASQFGNNLKTSVEQGVPLGLAVGGGLILSEPYLAPGAPIILSLTTVSTVGVSGAVSLFVFEVGTATDVLAAPAFCAANVF